MEVFSPLWLEVGEREDREETTFAFASPCRSTGDRSWPGGWLHLIREQGQVRLCVWSGDRWIGSGSASELLEGLLKTLMAGPHP